MYSLFLLCAALSAVLVVWLLVKQQLWKRPLGLFLLVADIVCLPLAMNAIGIVAKWVHTLMTFSYLTPWLFFVMAVEQLYRRDDLRKRLGKAAAVGLFSAGLRGSRADCFVRHPAGESVLYQGICAVRDDDC